MIVRALGKFNYVKYNDTMPINKKIEYMECYLKGRKLFSQYYVDGCTEKQNKYKQKLINTMIGVVVFLEEYGKCVPIEIIYEENKIRVKFLFLDKDCNIEMIVKYFTEKEVESLEIVDYDLEFLFK